MSPELIGILNQLPLHVILLIGIIVLWRDNKRLEGELAQVRRSQQTQIMMLEDQNGQLAQIKAQTNGLLEDARSQAKSR